MDEPMDDDDLSSDASEVSEAIMLRISDISEALTVLFSTWFTGMIELNAQDALRGLAAWRIISEDLQDLVQVVHENFGDGTDFEQAIKNQEEEWEVQARKIEELNDKLESLRENAENN